jgi:hypothetical protein
MKSSHTKSSNPFWTVLVNTIRTNGTSIEKGSNVERIGTKATAQT